LTDGNAFGAAGNFKAEKKLEGTKILELELCIKERCQRRNGN